MSGSRVQIVPWLWAFASWSGDGDLGGRGVGEGGAEPAEVGREPDGDPGGLRRRRRDCPGDPEFPTRLVPKVLAGLLTLWGVFFAEYLIDRWGVEAVYRRYSWWVPNAHLTSG